MVKNDLGAHVELLADTAYRAMSRDPLAYPEPDRFMPERFLNDGRLDLSVRDPLKFQFGFGRR